MQAKDKRMAELREVIATKDTSIQRFIKQNGSNVPYAKESSYTKIITDSYAEVSRIQTEKCALASKAMDLVCRVYLCFILKQNRQNAYMLCSDNTAHKASRS